VAQHRSWARGHAADGNGNERAFLWDPAKGMTNLATPRQAAAAGWWAAYAAERDEEPDPFALEAPAAALR
jgi:hypothetical protein